MNTQDTEQLPAARLNEDLSVKGASFHKQATYEISSIFSNISPNSSNSTSPWCTYQQLTDTTFVDLLCHLCGLCGSNAEVAWRKWARIRLHSCNDSCKIPCWHTSHRTQMFWNRTQISRNLLNSCTNFKCCGLLSHLNILHVSRQFQAIPELSHGHLPTVVFWQTGGEEHVVFSQTTFLYYTENKISCGLVGGFLSFPWVYTGIT